MGQGPLTNMTPGLPAGIDVSHRQGQINWRVVAGAGIVFAFAKATEGTRFVDHQFAVNWQEMQQVGILRGAYHFFRPDQDPHQQAQNFINQFTSSLEAGDLPLPSMWRFLTMWMWTAS